MKKTVKIKMALEIALCTATISSLALGTYAWFTVRGAEASISFWSMRVSEGLKWKIKYFTGNYETSTNSFAGYHDPRTPGKGGTVAKHCTSYSTQFVEIADGKYVEGGPLDIRHIAPGYCHTYSIEITSDYQTAMNVELRLTEFTCPESTTNLLYDNGTTTRGVTLGTAMDVYSKGYALTADDATNAASADNFLNDYILGNPTDNFDYDDVTHAIPANGYQLFAGVAPAKSSFVFFFTLEFTNLANTFYSVAKRPDETDAHTYWSRNTGGNSDAYENLYFQINTLYINTLGEAVSSSSSESAVSSSASV
jgi:hypothetical protein